MLIFSIFLLQYHKKLIYILGILLVLLVLAMLSKDGLRLNLKNKGLKQLPEDIDLSPVSWG